MILAMAIACTDEGLTEADFVYRSDELAAIDAVNAVRIDLGLSALEVEVAIGPSVRGHSEDMRDGRVAFGHDGFDARVDAIALEIPLSSAGENVAMNLGYEDPIAVAVQGWIDSPPHYENIQGDWDRTGIGIATGESGRWFTQIFVADP